MMADSWIQVDNTRDDLDKPLDYVRIAYAPDFSSANAYLKEQLNGQKSALQDQYGRGAKSAYVNYMQAKRDLPQQMGSIGAKGSGLAETSLVNLNADYGNNLSTLRNNMSDNVKSLEADYAKQVYAAMLQQAQAEAEAESRNAQYNAELQAQREALAAQREALAAQQQATVKKVYSGKGTSSNKATAITSGNQLGNAASLIMRQLGRGTVPADFSNTVKRARNSGAITDAEASFILSKAGY